MTEATFSISGRQARESQGDTTLVVAHERAVCGLVALADPAREEAPETVAKLRASGMHRIMGMYTGDNPGAASFIARSLGTEETAAGLLPEDKAEPVNALCSNGYVLAMVGDGINGALALGTAPGCREDTQRGAP